MILKINIPFTFMDGHWIVCYNASNIMNPICWTYEDELNCVRCGGEHQISVVVHTCVCKPYQRK